MVTRTSLGWRALVAALTLWLGLSWVASADEGRAQRLYVELAVAADGVVQANQTFTFGDAVPEALVQRLPGKKDAGGSYFKFTYSDISATIGDKPVDVTVTQDGGFTQIKVPLKDVGTSPVVVRYTVRGAVVADAQSAPLLSWRPLQGLSVEVVEVEGKVKAQAMMMSIDCTAGPPNSMIKCRMFAGATHEYPEPFFSDGPRGVGETVQLEVSYPVGSIAITQDFKHYWSLDRALTLDPYTALASLAVLALGVGALLLLHRRFGVDASLPAPRQIAEFAPIAAGQAEFREIDGIRPGHVGTIADERVDPVDVTATLLDLAVRGHLRIHQLPAQEGQVFDWAFERLPADEADLRPYEKTLLDAFTAEDRVRASNLAHAVGPIIFNVQDQLYDEVVARGWFAQRPDSTRNKWGRIAWSVIVLSLAAAVLLMAFTTWGLVGLALILVAAGLLWVAQHMPRRTQEGSAVLSGMTVLAGQLLTQPTTQFAPGEELTQISKLLPYSVVLGGRERWLQALVEADDDDDADPMDLDWYHAPNDWHLRDLPMALHMLVNVVQGQLFSR